MTFASRLERLENANPPPPRLEEPDRPLDIIFAWLAGELLMGEYPAGATDADKIEAKREFDELMADCAAAMALGNGRNS